MGTKWDDQRKAQYAISVYLLLMNDVENKRYSLMRQLYDAIPITNAMLVKHLKKKKYAKCNLEDMVFCDIAHIITDRLLEDEKLRVLFRNICHQQYPDTDIALKRIEESISIIYDIVRNDIKDKEIKEAEKMTFSEICDLCDIGTLKESEKKISEVNEIYKKVVVRNSRTSGTSAELFMNTLMVESDTIWESHAFQEVFSDLNTSPWDTINASEAELRRWGEDHVRFEDSEEYIFESKAFRQYKKNTKRYFAGYMNVPESKIIQYILDNVWSAAMASSDHNWIYSYITTSGICGFTLSSLTAMIQKDGWSMDWISNKENLPDVDLLIDVYCKAAVIDLCAKKKNKLREKAPGETLSGGLPPIISKYFTVSVTAKDFDRLLNRSPYSDDERYIYLVALFNNMLFFNMTKRIREQYYRHFSWDVICGQSVDSKAQKAIINDLYAQLSKKDMTIDSLTAENTALKEKNRKEDDAKHAEMNRLDKSYQKIVYEKDEEIKRLNEQIASMDEYISLISRPAAEPTVNYDLAELQKKRFVFIADYEDLMSKLRSAFKGSTFVTGATMDVRRMKPDAFVVLVRYVSHSLYTKIHDAGPGIPVILCNSQSFDGVCTEIASRLAAGS